MFGYGGNVEAGDNNIVQGNAIGAFAASIVNTLADNSSHDMEEQLVRKMEETGWYPSDDIVRLNNKNDRNTPFYNGRQMIVRMHANASLVFEDTYGVDVYDELWRFSNDLIEEMAADWNKTDWAEVIQGIMDNKHDHEIYWQRILESFKEKLISLGDVNAKVYDECIIDWETVTKHSDC
jgi:hypothetical protein